MSIAFLLIASVFPESCFFGNEGLPEMPYFPAFPSNAGIHLCQIRRAYSDDSALLFRRKAPYCSERIRPFVPGEMASPFSVLACALWMSLSRMASARVGSPTGGLRNHEKYDILKVDILVQH